MMLRLMKRIFIVIAMCALVFALYGCSGGGGGVTGKYVSDQKDPDGKSNGKLMLELKSGGVAVATITGPDGQSLPSVTGTYIVEGNTVTTTLDNDKDVYTYKDGTLTTQAFGETMVFKKQ